MAGQYVINDDGAMVWEADPQPDPTEVEHPLGATGEHAEEAEPKKAVEKKAAAKK